jgi:uncharacterized protein YhaN
VCADEATATSQQLADERQAAQQLRVELDAIQDAQARTTEQLQQAQAEIVTLQQQADNATSTLGTASQNNIDFLT